MTKAEQAKQLFLDGYNCAQAVFCAFADELGIDQKTALSLSACFGGGLGRQREVCGAVSGMCMALSVKYAPKDPTDQLAKAQFYKRVQEVCLQFKEENGSIICRELLGLPAGPSVPTPEKRTDAYYQHRTCADKVKCAAEILEKYLAEQK
ncbi:C-GCAxxG-C-C family protein [Candidatus Avelusimicrobium luingense]|uniref:C-GCAxxG-C-C family protein n=1 Tax=Candidatus Avelusimicrobium luingense TaxID=3416211 RepID=UPI003D12ADFC